MSSLLGGRKSEIRSLPLFLGLPYIPSPTPIVSAEWHRLGDARRCNLQVPSCPTNNPVLGSASRRHGDPPPMVHLKVRCLQSRRSTKSHLVSASHTSGLPAFKLPFATPSLHFQHRPSRTLVITPIVTKRLAFATDTINTTMVPPRASPRNQSRASDA